MSANVCIAYYGLRFEVASSDIESLELRTDARIIAARTAGLNHYWANFGGEAERYLLFIGKKIGIFGPENDQESSVTTEQFLAFVADTEKRFALTSLHGSPALHIRWEEHV